MTRNRLTTARIAVLGVFLAFAALLSAPGAVGAVQPGPDEVGIYVVAFACPDVDAEPYIDCDILSGATFQVEAEGVEIAGSPFTTGPTSLVPGFFFDAPAGATLTITELSGNPVGFAPAPVFDPLVINVADVPEVGCGGESTCPGIEFINTPFAVADGPRDDTEISDDTVLPNTGIGVSASGMSGACMLLAGLAVMLGLGAVTIRRQTVR